MSPSRRASTILREDARHPPAGVGPLPGSRMVNCGFEDKKTAPRQRVRASGGRPGAATGREHSPVKATPLAGERALAHHSPTGLCSTAA